MAVWKAVDLVTAETDYNNVRTASDSYQFAWVDGRNNNTARRVVINEDGEILCTTIGLGRPTEKATFEGVVFHSEDDRGTAIKKGKILLVCYTYRNELDEESNPSPITVLDTIQYQAKGSWLLDGVYYPYPVNEGEYVADTMLSGSIESFTLSVPITNDLAQSVRVYVAEAEYAEGLTPPTAFRLTATKDVPKGATSMSVSVAVPPSIIETDYERDLAPKGDDITLADGATFIANAVNGLGLPFRVAKIWALTITNNNSANYINRFHRIDLFDGVGVKPDGELDYFDDINWDEDDLDLIRFYDSDLTTPLDVYHYPVDSVIKIHEEVTVGDIADEDSVYTRMLALIRIPIIYSHSAKTIYLVQFAETPTDLPGRFTQLVLSGASTNQITIADFYESVTKNPVLNENEIVNNNPVVPVILNDVTIGLYHSATEIGSPSVNRANTYDADLNSADAVYDTVDGNLIIYDEFGQAEETLVKPDAKVMIQDMDEDVAFIEHQPGTNMSMRGHVCGWIKIPVEEFAVDSDTGLFRFAFNTDLGDKLSVHYIDDLTDKYFRIRQYVAGVGDTDYDETEFNLTDQSVSVADQDSCFVFMSWEQDVNTTVNSGSTVKVTLAIYVNGYFASKEITINDLYLNPTKPYEFTMVQKNTDTGTSTPYYFNTSYYALRFGTYISDPYAILNLARFMPYYDIEGIGAFKTFVANDATPAGLCFSNTNVSIEVVSLLTGTQPGRIQWGSYGEMPDLNEYSINEDIMRIMPMKSLMPTDEHNTILIFTQQGDIRNVYRLALMGTNALSCAVIKDLPNLGLVNADALCEMLNGVAWVSREGVITLTASGLQYVSRGRLSLTADARLTFDPIRNWLWVRDGALSTYVYQVADDKWWQYSQAVMPDQFIQYTDGGAGWLCLDDMVFYEDGSAASSGEYVTCIKTPAYPTGRKLRRHKLIASVFTGTYKYLVRLFGAWITGGTAVSSQYTASANKYTSAPSTKSDYAQLELTEVNNVIAIEIEDN